MSGKANTTGLSRFEMLAPSTVTERIGEATTFLEGCGCPGDGVAFEDEVLPLVWNSLSEFTMKTLNAIGPVGSVFQKYK